MQLLWFVEAPPTNAFFCHVGMVESPSSTLLTTTITTIIIALSIVHNPIASYHYHYHYITMSFRRFP